jgi:hypothetical protein
MLGNGTQNSKNVRFEEIETILIGLGFEKRQHGTNHAVFKRGRHIVPIPTRPQQVLPVYVKQVIRIIDELEDEMVMSDDDPTDEVVA